MNKLIAKLLRLATDSRGAEVTELGLVLAILVAGAVGTIALIGPKIASFYATTNSVLP
jgi:Flp pilus assembly pilin Flp